MNFLNFNTAFMAALGVAAKQGNGLGDYSKQEGTGKERARASVIVPQRDP